MRAASTTERLSLANRCARARVTSSSMSDSTARAQEPVPCSIGHRRDVPVRITDGSVVVVPPPTHAFRVIAVRRAILVGC